ncbi:hypothetical protein ABPG77_010839 [Micractinium sp. CCAP 211/92]
MSTFPCTTLLPSCWCNRVQQGPARTSALQAPIMLLSGHGDAVFTMRFNPEGDVIASGSHDKHIFLWRTYGDCENYMMLKGHKNAVLEVRCWDAVTGEQGPPLLVSGGDDCEVKLWDLRQKRAVKSFSERYQILTGVGHAAVRPANRCTKVFAGHVHTFEKNLLRCDWSPDGQKVTAGSGDRCVYIWSAATRALMYKLPGHGGSVNECVFHPREPVIGSASSDKTIYLGELAQ